MMQVFYTLKLTFKVLWKSTFSFSQLPQQEFGINSETTGQQTIHQNLVNLSMQSFRFRILLHIQTHHDGKRGLCNDDDNGQFMLYFIINFSCFLTVLKKVCRIVVMTTAERITNRPLFASLWVQMNRKHTHQLVFAYNREVTVTNEAV